MQNGCEKVVLLSPGGAIAMFSTARFRFLAGTLFLGLAAVAFAQRWEYLGEANVDGAVDHDRIMVTAAKGEYRAIEIRVEKGPIVFDHVVVHFGNGSSDPIAIRSRIPAGGKTRVIDLPGNHRVIESVEFWYERGSLVSEKPRVRLWGLH
jgi:hypothetical protein